MGALDPDLRGVFDEEQVSEMRNAIEAADQTDRDEVCEIAERFELLSTRVFGVCNFDKSVRLSV